MVVRKPRCRSGCLTCRARKIKCDEAKPSCIKCTSTGRKCDGYEVLAPATPRSSSSRSQSPIDCVQKSTCSTTPTISSYLSPFSYVPAEFRALDYFRARTSSALCSTFDSDFWTTEVLKLSLFDPVIKNSLVALGSLHEGFELASRPEAERRNIETHRLMAIKHYTIATNQLQRRLSAMNEQSPMLLLVASLILFSMEILQDNYRGAITHLDGSLNLLASFYPGQRHETQSSQTSEMEDEIARTLVRVAVQAMYLQETTFHIGLTPQATLRTQSFEFKSTLEAKEHLEARALSIYRLFWEIKQPLATLESNERLYQAEVVAFGTWRRAFSDLLLRLGPNPPPKDRLRAELLNINYHSLITLLDSANPDETQRTFPADFSRILDLIFVLLDPPNDEPCQLPRFSFDGGVIGPLFYIAVRAPNIKLRYRALQLLHHPNIPHREGMWASGMAAAMAGKIVSLEAELVNWKSTDLSEEGVVMMKWSEEVKELQPFDELDEVLDSTWFDLADLTDERRMLNVSVGLGGGKELGIMPCALKQGVITWETW